MTTRRLVPGDVAIAPAGVLRCAGRPGAAQRCCVRMSGAPPLHALTAPLPPLPRPPGALHIGVNDGCEPETHLVWWSSLNTTRILPASEVGGPAALWLPRWCASLWPCLPGPPAKPLPHPFCSRPPDFLLPARDGGRWAAGVAGGSRDAQNLVHGRGRSLALPPRLRCASAPRRAALAPPFPAPAATLGVENLTELSQAVSVPHSSKAFAFQPLAADSGCAARCAAAGAAGAPAPAPPQAEPATNFSMSLAGLAPQLDSELGSFRTLTAGGF